METNKEDKETGAKREIWTILEERKERARRSKKVPTIRQNKTALCSNSVLNMEEGFGAQQALACTAN